MTQLRAFAFRALRQLPALLWWVLAGLTGAVLSIVFNKEVFPNTPVVLGVAQWVALSCGLALPLLGIGWLWRVARIVHHPGWRLLWYVAAMGATVAGVGLLAVGLLLALLQL